MKIGILTTSPIFFFGPYAKQALILIKFFIKEHDIYFISNAYSHNNQDKNPIIMSLTNVKKIQYDENIYINNKEVIDKLKFISLYNNNNNGIYISYINKCIGIFKLNKIITILDLIRFVIDEHKFNCEIISWFPNHYEPIDYNSLYVLKMIDKIITLSKDGEKIIKKRLPNKYITTIPHVIELNIPCKNKYDIRKEFDIPDNKYLICIVGGNYEINNRRSLDTSILAFEKFYKQYSNAFLYIQSISYKNLDFISDLHRIIAYLDLPIESYNINQTKVPYNKILEIYKMADICLFGSRAEGFGLPNIEAQLCGSIVITNGFSALTEYTYNGISVPPLQQHYDNIGDGIWSIPSINGITDAMIELYNNPIQNKEDNIQKIKYHTSYDNVKRMFNNILYINTEKQELIDIIIRIKINDSDSDYIIVNIENYKKIIKNRLLISTYTRYNKHDILKNIFAPMIIIIDINCILNYNWLDSIPNIYSTKIIKPCVILKTEFNYNILSNDDKLFILVESKYLYKTNEFNVNYILKIVKHLNIPIIMTENIVNNYK